MHGIADNPLAAIRTGWCAGLRSDDKWSRDRPSSPGQLVFASTQPNASDMNGKQARSRIIKAPSKLSTARSRLCQMAVLVTGSWCCACTLLTMGVGRFTKRTPTLKEIGECQT